MFYHLLSCSCHSVSSFPLLVPGLCVQQQKDGVRDVCNRWALLLPLFMRLLIVLKQTRQRAWPLHRVQKFKNKVESFFCSLRSVVLGDGKENCLVRVDAVGKQVYSHRFSRLVPFSGQALEMRASPMHRTHPVQDSACQRFSCWKPKEDNPWVSSLSTFYKGIASKVHPMGCGARLCEG